jgi:hypothetical protein
VIQGVVEFLEHLMGIDESLKPGPLDELLFVAPARVNSFETLPLGIY